MSLRNYFGIALALLGVACGSAACIVEHDHDGGGYVGGGSAPPASAGGPIVAVVDTGKIMTVTAGDGVGVFVEYAAGGHWRIAWTCDTNKTKQACAMNVNVSAANGIANAAFETGTDPSATFSVGPGTLQIASSTSTTIDAIDFDTAPGAIITVDAAVGGLRDGKFLFFVQNGLVNGGYTGTLTDPLQLEPSSP